MEKKLIIIIILSAFVLSSCKSQVDADNDNAEFPAETTTINLTTSITESELVDEGAIIDSSMNSSISSIENSGDVQRLSSEDIYEAPIIKNYLKMNTVIDTELTREKIAEGYALTNKSIQYYYDDEGNLTWVKVTSDNMKTIGPIGIKIGDSFQEVLSLFPQEKDWRESENGEFYGESSESDEPFLGALGRAATYDFDGNNYKDMTLVTETQLPFFQLNFVNETLTEYRIYINIRID